MASKPPQRPPGPGAIYRALGVEPIINGSTTMTALGGSLMPPEVLDAMRAAADSFVDLYELQAAVGQRIAALTRNEAAFVSAGAAAGLTLAAAVSIARKTADSVFRLEGMDGAPRAFVIQRRHRNPFDPLVELVGGHLREVADGDADALAAALDGRTAAVFFLAGALAAEETLPLEQVVAVAHARDIPVIVDAAAQLPPVDNLWRLTGVGADIVIFSGGKALCGPAGTGLVLGARRWVERFPRNAAPHEPREAIGRPMKVGKEELVGILAAVEWYLALDHGALAAHYEQTLDHFLSWGRGRADVTVTREPLGEAGQPIPRAHIALADRLRPRGAEILATLRAGPPRIDLLGAPDGLYVAPETLRPGEETLISARLGEVLDGLAASVRST